MKIVLLLLIVFAALIVIACGVWVTRALILDLWPRKSAEQPACNLEQVQESPEAK
jgi:hypothetical protein